KKANRAENVQRGKEMIAESLKRQGYTFAEAAKSEYFAELLKQFNMNEPEDIYAAVGYGGVTTGQVTHKLLEQVRKERAGGRPAGTAGKHVGRGRPGAGKIQPQRRGHRPGERGYGGALCPLL